MTAASAASAALFIRPAPAGPCQALGGYLQHPSYGWAFVPAGIRPGRADPGPAGAARGAEPPADIALEFVEGGLEFGRPPARTVPACAHGGLHLPSEVIFPA